MQENNKVGERVGSFVILEETDRYFCKSIPKGVRRWLCECVHCGSEIKLTRQNIKKRSSCGCKTLENRQRACRDNFSKNPVEILEGNRIEVDRGHSTPCWELNMKPHHSGYFYLYNKGEGLAAHRLSYQTYVGEIPDGLEISHLCHNCGCHNPDHLIAETHKENMQRSEGRGVMSKPKVINLDIAKEIKELLKEGRGSTEIAGILDVPATIVTDIKRGKTWKHA